MPSRKWWVRTVTALAGLATSVITTGGWDQEESVMAVTIFVAAFTSYMTPNEKDTTP